MQDIAERPQITDEGEHHALPSFLANRTAAPHSTPMTRYTLRSRFWSRHLTRWQGSRAYRLWLSRQQPRRVILLPTDPWPGQPERGEAIVHGEWLSGTRTWPFHPNSWAGAAGNLPMEVHGFQWLRDLHALGGPRARLTARKLVEGWLEHHGRMPLPGERADLAGDRLANWLMHYSFFATGASDGFCTALHESMVRQVHLLRHRFATIAPGRERFSILFGLAFATACLEPGNHDHFPAVLAELERELAAQLNEEGAHRTCSPKVHLGVLRDLIALRGLCHTRQWPVSEALQDSILAMGDVLRFLRLGDGGLPLWHGTPALPRQMVEQTLSLCGPLSGGNLPISALGLQRLQAGQMVLLMDTVLPDIWSQKSHHASPLAFELSIGRHRVITGCGWLEQADAGWQQALKQTAAHSALVLNDTSAAETAVAGAFQPLTAINVQHTPQRIEAMHNGWQAAFSVRHTRRLEVMDNGRRLAGEDHLDGPERQDAVIRFHLAPNVRPVLEPERNRVYLDLPDKDLWIFEAHHGSVVLEDSLYFDASGQPRQTRQIVITFTTDAPQVTCKWELHKA